MNFSTISNKILAFLTGKFDNTENDGSSEYDITDDVCSEPICPIDAIKFKTIAIVEQSKEFERLKKNAQEKADKLLTPHYLSDKMADICYLDDTAIRGLNAILTAAAKDKRAMSGFELIDNEEPIFLQVASAVGCVNDYNSLVSRISKLMSINLNNKDTSDWPSISRVIDNMLCRLGYYVITASSVNSNSKILVFSARRDNLMDYVYDERFHDIMTYREFFVDNEDTRRSIKNAIIDAKKSRNDSRALLSAMHK